jgi:hypothetical protein
VLILSCFYCRDFFSRITDSEGTGEWGIIIGFPTGRHKKQKDLPAPKSTDKSHHLKQSQEENKFSGHVVDLTTTGVDYSLIVMTIIAPTKEIVKRFLYFFARILMQFNITSVGEGLAPPAETVRQIVRVWERWGVAPNPT